MEKHVSKLQKQINMMKRAITKNFLRHKNMIMASSPDKYRDYH